MFSLAQDVVGKKSLKAWSNDSFHILSITVIEETLLKNVKLLIENVAMDFPNYL